MDAKALAILGAVLIAGAILNERFNIPVMLPQMAVAAIIAVGGLCLAAFLVLGEIERRAGAVPGPLVEQEGGSHAQAPDRQHEAGVEPRLPSERQGQPDDHGDGPDDAEPSRRGKHGRG